MFVLWYCHKRGREVRLEQELSDTAIDGGDRIEELPDDPLLPAPEMGTPRLGKSKTEPALETSDLPPSRPGASARSDSSRV